MKMSDIAGFLSLQNSRLLTIKTPLAGRSELVLSEFQCSEGLSVLFDMRLGLVSRDPTIELKQMIGQAVTISLQPSGAIVGGSPRHFHGYVTQFSHTGADGGLATYSATVQPWLWMLSRRVDSRIFQDKSARDILDAVFSQYSALASYEFRAGRTLKPYSYCTQYRETDLNFVLRLMELEGLFSISSIRRTDTSWSSTTIRPVQNPSTGRRRCDMRAARFSRTKRWSRNGRRSGNSCPARSA